MLGKLVNKFKKHSLQEEIASNPGASPNNANSGSSRTAAQIAPTAEEEIATTLPQQVNRGSAQVSALYEVSFYRFIWVFYYFCFFFLN